MARSRSTRRRFHSRLIPLVEIGHPDLPRQRECPRVANPGAFCLWRSQGIHPSKNHCSFICSEASGCPRPRQGHGDHGRMCAAHRCLGASCAGMETADRAICPYPIAGWRQPAIRNIEPPDSSGMDSDSIRCARLCRQRMPEPGRRCSTMTLAQR